MLCPSLNLGGYCRQTHAVWGGEGQDHQQPAGWSWANYYTTAMVIRYLRSANISLYHTMVLSAVTHSLVIGRKVRNEDPTADTSMVTRPPHHTYNLHCAGGQAAACRHRFRSYFEFYKYFHTTAYRRLWLHRDQQPVIQNWSMCQCWNALAWLCCCVFEFENM